VDRSVNTSAVHAKAGLHYSDVKCSEVQPRILWWFARTQSRVQGFPRNPKLYFALCTYQHMKIAAGLTLVAKSCTLHGAFWLPGLADYPLRSGCTKNTLWVVAPCSVNMSQPEPSPESFQKGGFAFLRGARHSKNWQKLHWFIVGLELCLGGLSPPKPPHSDGTGHNNILVKFTGDFHFQCNFWSSTAFKIEILKFAAWLWPLTSMQAHVHMQNLTFLMSNAHTLMHLKQFLYVVRMFKHAFFLYYNHLFSINMHR